MERNSKKTTKKVQDPKLSKTGKTAISKKKRKKRSGRFGRFLLALAILGVLGALYYNYDRDPDPVEVFDGSNNIMITPYKDVTINDITKEDFIADQNGFPVYKGDGYTCVRGVDVSYYQGNVDWATVKASGIDFAFIRIGYRGWSNGSISKDEKFETYLKEAREAGLKVGIYFFSQAVTVEEAQEEAELVLLAMNNREIDLPIAFDWEIVEGEDDSRTNEIDRETVTAIAQTFCQTIADGGYDPCIYMNLDLAYHYYDLSALKDYYFWLTSPGSYPNFYYFADIWQYSFEGKVQGITGTVDLNYIFLPKETEEGQTSE